MTVVVGIDVGGTKTNATVLSETGTFLIDHMVEVRSRVTDGPAAAIEAIAAVFSAVLQEASAVGRPVLAVGLDTPGQPRKCVASRSAATKWR